MSKINDINYTFFIDKKKTDGYDYPKIFILPYQFDQECYNGTLLECELIRKKNKKWCIGINDIYYHSGTNCKKTIIIDRMNKVHNLLINNYTENEFTNICPLFIKKYFDYKDINYVINEFSPNLDYNIRGIYFVPLKVEYSNILYILPKDTIKENIIKKDTKCFRIMKTLKPDVYDLYLNKDNDLIKQGIALVQNISLSHTLVSYFNEKDYDSEILVECKYNDRFKKWEPITLSEGPIDNI